MSFLCYFPNLVYANGCSVQLFYGRANKKDEKLWATFMKHLLKAKAVSDHYCHINCFGSIPAFFSALCLSSILGMLVCSLKLNISVGVTLSMRQVHRTLKPCSYLSLSCCSLQVAISSRGEKSFLLLVPLAVMTEFFSKMGYSTSLL